MIAQWLLSCALLTSNGVHVACTASQPSATSSLSVRMVYKQPILHGPDLYVPIRQAHLVGRNRILLASRDNRLFMCDMQDGSIVWDIHGTVLGLKEDDLRADGCVQAARYEVDGTLGLLIVGIPDVRYLRYDKARRMIERFDLAHVFNGNYAEILRFPMHDSLILAPEGPPYNRTINLIELPNGEVKQRLAPKPAKHWITSLNFSADGRYAAATGSSVYVWDLSTGKRINDVYQPSDEVLREWLKPGVGGYRPTACAFSRDGKLLAVGTAGAVLLVFEVSSGKLLALLERCPGHWGPVEYLTFLGDTGYILGAGGELRVYDFPERRWVDVEAFRTDQDIRGVGGVAVEGNSIFVCDYSGNLRRYQWETVGTESGKPR